MSMMATTPDNVYKSTETKLIMKRDCWFICGDIGAFLYIATETYMLVEFGAILSSCSQVDPDRKTSIIPSSIHREERRVCLRK